MKVSYYSAGYMGKGDSFDAIRKYAYVCAVSCSTCGHLLSVSWENDVDTSTIPEKAKNKIKVCPVCGKKTPLKKDLSVVTKKTSNTAAVVLLENMLSQKIEKDARKRVEALISKNTTNDIYADNNTAKIVTDDIELLKKHIRDLITAESAVYFLSERMVALYKAQDINNKRLAKEAIVTEQKNKDAKKDNERARKQAIQTLKKENTLLKKQAKDIETTFDEEDWTAKISRHEIIRPRKLETLSFKIPPKPVEPQLKQAGLFNKKKISAENDKIIAEYEAELSAYNNALKKAEFVKAENQRREIEYQDAIKKYNKSLMEEDERINAEAMLLKESAVKELDEKIAEIKNKIEENKIKISQLEAEDSFDLNENNEQIVETQNAVGVFLEREMCEIQSQIKQVLKMREQLYSYNVIHTKYRNSVALSTIYEYLDTCRCSGLVGADGAYNLYESECRSNLIISQLSVVIDTLEEIKQTQYMIYSELKQMNTTLLKINNTMEKAVDEIISLRTDVAQMNCRLDEISFNTAQIGSDTTLIAENTKTTAKNSTDILAETKIISANTEKIKGYSAVTAHYSAVNAYYSKLNTQLTNSIGFMLALK